MSDPTETPAETASPRAEPTVKTRAEFDALMAGAKGPVLVDFIQPDCGPCIEETANFQKLAADCSNGPATVVRVDITDGDFGTELATKLEVEGTPTALFAESAAAFNAGKTRELSDLTSSAARRKLKCSVK